MDVASGPVADIGGVVKENSSALKYLFSGLVQVENALEAELKALEFLIQVIHRVHRDYSKILFCTDFVEAINKFKFKWLHGELQNYFDPTVYVNFLHVARDLNTETDELAIKGTQCLNLIGAWV